MRGWERGKGEKGKGKRRVERERRVGVHESERERVRVEENGFYVRGREGRVGKVELGSLDHNHLEIEI